MNVPLPASGNLWQKAGKRGVLLSYDTFMILWTWVSPACLQAPDGRTGRATS